MLFYKKGVFMDKAFLNDCLSEIGVNLAPNALDKLEGYFGMIVEQNKAFKCRNGCEMMDLGDISFTVRYKINTKRKAFFRSMRGSGI